MFKINPKSMKGFTLIEVLVAVALVSIIGIGLLTALGGASTVLLKADSRETARDLAQAQMEYLQSLPFDNDTYILSADLDADHPGFSSTIDPPVNIEVDHLQEITIVVLQGSVEKFSLTGRKVNW